MSGIHRFSTAFVVIVSAVLIVPAGFYRSSSGEQIMGYALPAVEGAVPADLAKINPRETLASSISIVQAAGVPTAGDAVLNVIIRAQGDRFTYADPQARDANGALIWGNGSRLPADTLSTLRSDLQAAMVVDFGQSVRTTMSEKEFARLGLERFTRTTIGALELLAHGGSGADLVKSEGNYALLNEFRALGISDAVFAVDKAALADGMRLTLSGGGPAVATEEMRALGMLILLSLLIAVVTSRLGSGPRREVVPVAG